MDYKYGDIYEKELAALRELASPVGVVVYTHTSGLLGSVSFRQDIGIEMCIPEPTTLEGIAIFLHECGHVYNGDIMDLSTGEAAISRPPILERERKATEWATDRFIEHGIYRPTAIKTLEKAYRTYEKKYGQAA